MRAGPPSPSGKPAGRDHAKRVYASQVTWRCRCHFGCAESGSRGASQPRLL